MKYPINKKVNLKDLKELCNENGIIAGKDNSHRIIEFTPNQLEEYLSCLKEGERTPPRDGIYYYRGVKIFIYEA